MLSGLERFKSRKQVKGVLEVKYLPPSLFINYIKNDLGDDDRGPSDLLEDEKAEAEAKYLELKFFLKRLNMTQMRVWDMKAVRGIFGEEHVEHVARVLVEQFERAEHTPKSGAALEFTKESFADLVSNMPVGEIISLGDYFRKALREDEERAFREIVEGNGRPPAQALSAQ